MTPAAQRRPLAVIQLLRKPASLGALEYVARLVLVPLVAVLLWTGLARGWHEAWNPAALVLADLLLAVRWRRFRPIGRRVQDPGGSLGPLSKLVMVGALLLAPLMVRDGVYLTGALIAVLAAASAGLWLGWRWAAWAWLAYAVAAMAGWLTDAATLFGEAVRSEQGLPMARLEPLLASLPSALFAIAVVVWVLEWRQRTRPGAS